MPQDFFDQLPSAYSGKPTDWNAFFLFTEGGKIYFVSRGKCIPNRELCKEGTFYVIRASEVIEPGAGEVNFGRGFRLWPGDLGPDLISAPSDGALADKAKYEEHQEFYDMFFGDTMFIQGTYLFESVKVVKRER